MHACEIARELGIGTVIVPREAGALSALGMLLADRTRDYSAGALGVTDHEVRFRKLERQARKDMASAKLERFADIRYAGQSYELTVAWGKDPRGNDAARSFHAEHRRIYGYSDPRRATQVVTLRVRAVVRVPKPSLELKPQGAAAAAGKRRVWIGGRWRQLMSAPREAIGKKAIRGPALITDYGSTTLVPEGWSIRWDEAGSLILRCVSESSASR